MKKLCAVLLLLVLISLSACNKTSESELSPSDSISSSGLTDTNSNYRYRLKGQAVTIISHQYNPEENEIIIPEKIDGNTVTAIEGDAFYQHKNTVSIVLPSGLERIEGSPFYRCYSLKRSFIPRNVNSINGNPYFRCSSLESITVDAQNQYFSDDNGVLFNKDKTILIAYPEGKTVESYTIPSTVTKIEGDAFGYHTQIKELYILSNVIDFPDYNMFIYPQDIKIYVESGSASEAYAKEFGLNYEIISEE